MNRATAACVLVAVLVLAATIAAGCGSSTSGDTATTAGTSPGGTATTQSSPSSVVAADGQSIFESNCVRCHGRSGQGVTGPNLQNETDAAKVENQVRGGGQVMPAFGGQLTDAEISAVAQYVLSLPGD